ncbi:hypothetical protein AYI68_g3750 [Smittium mucronatum]|uniref:Uncharacterized protein n=1 Tax=Smittium mucronatum TaxID=133383 RepID=A0A1R0GZ07_9FUNG|nr:hypothetical protein AYI68_g3750 [Smittium mucronatum]
MASSEALSRFPIDNREAVGELWKVQVMGFLDDGIDEMKQAILELKNELPNNPQEQTPNVDASDLSLHFKSLNISSPKNKYMLLREYQALLISCNLVLSKIQKNIMIEPSNSTLNENSSTIVDLNPLEYDQLLEYARQIPELSDDLVYLSLYSDNKNDWQQPSIAKAKELSQLSILIIDTSSRLSQTKTINKIKNIFLSFLTKTES